MLPRKIGKPSFSLWRSFSSASSSGCGKIFSYGEGYLGSLGHGKFEDIKSPKLIVEEPIRQISAGWAHSGFINDKGEAYLFGRTHGFKNTLRATNMHRASSWLVDLINFLGGGSNIESPLPKLVPLPNNEKASQLYCSAALSLIRTECGKAYGIGANSYGQVGNGKDNSDVWSASRVKGLDDQVVTKVASGYQHGLLITKDGQVYSWGKGESGQLGFGSVNITYPHHVVALQDKRVVDIGAGFNHSAALTDDGELFVWGKLLSDEPGDQKDQLTPRAVKMNSRITKFSSSQFHTLFLTEDNRVWFIGRSRTVSRVVQNDVVRENAKVNTLPVEIKVDGSALDGVKIKNLGRGVYSSYLISSNGKAFRWNAENGIELVHEVKGLCVESFESGFSQNVVLAK